MLRRMLPGLNSAAVGLIVASVFSLTFQIYHASPFPMTTICIGARTSFTNPAAHAECLLHFLSCPESSILGIGPPQASGLTTHFLQLACLPSSPAV